VPDRRVQEGARRRHGRQRRVTSFGFPPSRLQTRGPALVRSTTTWQTSPSLRAARSSTFGSRCASWPELPWATPSAWRRWAKRCSGQNHASGAPSCSSQLDAEAGKHLHKLVGLRARRTLRGQPASVKDLRRRCRRRRSSSRKRRGATGSRTRKRPAPTSPLSFSVY
jgi:hypothetical protein